MTKQLSPNEEVDFVAIASHQLRTPLTVMSGYLAMILAGDFGRLEDDKLKAALTAVFQANERLLRLVENLLNTARLETGKLELSLKPAALDELLDSIVAEMRPRAEHKGLTLRREGSAASTALIDELLLRQAIINVLDNAIKYTAQGDVAIEAVRHDRHLTIMISDSGPGLTDAQMKGLFTKFSRRDVAGSADEGFGLGLYVCRLIVESHGGTVSAERGPEGGLAVSLTIPVLS